MNTNQELYKNFANFPSVNIIEGSHNPLAKGDEISDGFTFDYVHGDLTIAGEMSITANKKLFSRMDYAIGDKVEFCIATHYPGHESFTAYDNCWYKPAIQNSIVTHLRITTHDSLATTHYQLVRHSTAPFLDLEQSSVLDPIVFNEN